jgi:hypothetical protein
MQSNICRRRFDHSFQYILRKLCMEKRYELERGFSCLGTIR